MKTEKKLAKVGRRLNIITKSLVLSIVFLICSCLSAKRVSVITSEVGVGILERITGKNYSVYRFFDSAQQRTTRVLSPMESGYILFSEEWPFGTMFPAFYDSVSKKDSLDYTKPLFWKNTSTSIVKGKVCKIIYPRRLQKEYGLIYTYKLQEKEFKYFQYVESRRLSDYNENSEIFIEYSIKRPQWSRIWMTYEPLPFDWVK